MRSIIRIYLLACLLTGCASYGQIENQPLPRTATQSPYSISQAVRSDLSREITLVLAFSGGGTRAAALSYGVLQALRDNEVVLGDKPRRLLDEIDLISSVSGGSFTAAYFGLNGEHLFGEFETEFLRRNITGELIQGLFNPRLWFTRRGRTEMAVRYYERTVFKGATFADLHKNAGPLIVINATDVNRGVRFSFLQDYFDLICSDLSSFPVSRAVTASSAVPILFNPVVLKNHADCDQIAVEHLLQMKPRANQAQRLVETIEGLSEYANKQDRQYIHLMDGGITDNLGLLAIYEMVEIAGGAKPFLKAIGGKPTPRLVVVSVNAATNPQHVMDSTNKVPSFEQIIKATSRIQLHRANTNTLDLFRESMQRWSAELSTPEAPVEPYFIEINFDRILQPDRRFFFNQIPVDFSLDKEQIDELIKAGRELLFTNEEFNRLLDDLK